MKNTNTNTNSTNAVLNTSEIVALLSSYDFPISMSSHVQQIAPILDIDEVIETANKLVQSHPLIDELAGKVVDKMLFQPEFQSINDGSNMFKKSMISVVGTIIENCIPWSTKVVKYFDDQGNLTSRETKYYSNASEGEYSEPEYARLPETYESVYIMKGSKKQIHCSVREKHLNMLSQQEFMVREIDHDLVYTYANMKFSENVGNVKYSPSKYLKELESFASVTIAHAGMTYQNIRKFDGAGRHYPVPFFGFAKEHGDSFEKWLIQTTYFYRVTKDDIKLAKAFLKSEFKVKSWRKLFEKASKEIEKARRLNKVFEAGRKVTWNIDSKTFGKYLWIQEICNSIIYNEGGVTNALIGVDISASGPTMYANQFGDRKWMNGAGLLGTKGDFHQAVADALGIGRDDAKKVFVAPHHGGRVDDELIDIVNSVFGERYHLIRQIAEYGIKCAFAGVPYITYEAFDGLMMVWNPYIKNCRVGLELSDLAIHAIMPFTQGLEGEKKVSGLAVQVAHGSDGYLMRKVERHMFDADLQVKTTLDAVYCRPALVPVIRKIVNQGLEDLTGWYKAEFEKIQAQTGIKAEFTIPDRELPLHNPAIM